MYSSSSSPFRSVWCSCRATAARLPFGYTFSCSDPHASWPRCPSSRTRRAADGACPGGVGLCVLALSFSFFVTRYGNEQFEQISDGAVAAVETVYSLTPNGGRFLFVSPHIPGDTLFIPVGYRDVERVDWDRLDAPIEPADVTGLVDVMREGGPGTYLITTRSQENYLTFGSGYPPDWGTQFRRAMAAAPGVRVVVDNPDASVYTFDWRPGQTPKPFIPPPPEFRSGARHGLRSAWHFWSWH